MRPIACQLRKIASPCTPFTGGGDDLSLASWSGSGGARRGGAEGPGAASRLGHTQNEATDLPADEEPSTQTRQDRGAMLFSPANSTALTNVETSVEPAERLGFLVGGLPG